MSLSLLAITTCYDAWSMEFLKKPMTCKVKGHKICKEISIGMEIQGGIVNFVTDALEIQEVCTDEDDNNSDISYPP